jgi:hypothetical protein
MMHKDEVCILNARILIVILEKIIGTGVEQVSIVLVQCLSIKCVKV